MTHIWHTRYDLFKSLIKICSKIKSMSSFNVLGDDTPGDTAVQRLSDGYGEICQSKLKDDHA